MEHKDGTQRWNAKMEHKGTYTRLTRTTFLTTFSMFLGKTNSTQTVTLEGDANFHLNWPVLQIFFPTTALYTAN